MFDIKDTSYIESLPVVPEWLSDEGLKTLQRGYLLPGETPKDLYYRVACTAAKILKRPELMRDFFDILYKSYLGLATPVAANFGANRALPISCYSNFISDSISSIYSHLKEVAMMSKLGGGVGIFMGDIRPSGSKISGGGVSTGIVPVAQQYDKCSSYVSQNGIRKGSFAMYLPIEHPDAYELLLAKDHLEGDPRKMIDSNIAFTITDDFIERLLSGDTMANKVWAKALEMNLKVGSPYFIFIDNVNRLNPPAYNNHGLKVTTSNLCCLTGDTLVKIKYNKYDKDTYNVPIKDLVNKEVFIYDGDQWVLNNQFKSYGKAPVYEVKVDFRGTIHTYKMTINHRCVVYNKLEDTYEFKTLGEIFHYTHTELVYDTPTSMFRQGVGTLISAVALEQEEEVFCTTVESSSMFKLGTGMMTGNSEIMLYTDENHSFVCCLSSLNLFKWEEWKDWKGVNSNKSVVELSIYLLDAVLEEFIIKAKNKVGMGRSVRSAEKGRAIGLGVQGLHYLYQLKGLPFKSKEARKLNIDIFKQIQKEAIKASEKLGTEYGIPEWCVGTKQRHTHLTACVTKDTKLLTKTGNVPIINLIDTQTEIWNGHEWTIVTPFKTSEGKQVYKIELSDGSELTCSDNHEWLIKNNRFKSSVIKTTVDLKLDDKLEKWDLPIIDGDVEFPYAYTAGFFTGDSSYNKSNPQYENCKNRKEIRLFGVNNDKHPCLSKITIKSGCSIRKSDPKGHSGQCLRFYIPDEVPEKYTVPAINCTLDSKLNWLAGLFDSDGDKKGRLSNKYKSFLLIVKEMCLSLGMTSKLSVTHNNEDRTPLYVLCFNLENLQILNNYTVRVKFKKGNRSCGHYVKIKSITKLDIQPTYCVTDPINGTALFNGIKTKQCAPTRTNSVISGAFSPGIEPIDSNSYTAKQAKGSFIRKNGLLQKLLQSKEKDTPEVWDSILDKNGSVMHLDFLTIEEKLVFLTAREIDQEELIRQAADRTPYICQGQSLNRFVHPDIPVKYLNELVLKAWKGGVKSTYYTKSSSDKIIEKVRNEAHIITKEGCPYCSKAKDLLNKYNIQYTEYKLEEIKDFPWKTVPQIWWQGHFIGGYIELLEYIKLYEKSGNKYEEQSISECSACEA